MIYFNGLMGALVTPTLRLILGILLFCHVSPANAQAECENNITNILSGNFTGSICKSTRIALHRRCLTLGGSDELTNNCADHTFPEDAQGIRQSLFTSCMVSGGKDQFTDNCFEHLRSTDPMPPLKLSFKTRERLYRHCRAKGGNWRCCDHLSDSDQCKLGVCDKDDGSKVCIRLGVRKEVAAVPVAEPEPFESGVVLICKNPVLEITARSEFWGFGQSCSEALEKGKADADAQGCKGIGPSWEEDFREVISTPSCP